MGKWKQKLKNQTGASMMIALLLFLICATISSSLLMMASTNAGKMQDVKEEQQKYLALSSAVELVCDEICASSYSGKYQYEEEDENYIYHLQEGNYSTASVEESPLFKTVLLDDLDYIFYQYLSDYVTNKGENYKAKYKNENAPVEPQKHVLEVEEFQGYHVKIELLVVKESYAIEMVATLQEDPAYSMQIELTPSETKPHISEETHENGMTYETNKMTWSVGWITTGSDEDV